MYLYLGMVTMSVFVSSGVWTVVSLAKPNITAKPKKVPLLTVEEAKLILLENEKTEEKSVALV